MLNDFEQINEMIKAVENNGDLSIWKRDRKNLAYLNLLTTLTTMPKTAPQEFDASRVKAQILKRIELPKAEKHANWTSLKWVGFSASLLILISLTLGTAVAALESTPGSAIYPMKKIVENIEQRLTPQDQQVALQLKFAANRAEELQQVLDKKDEGKLTDQQTQQIIASTVQDLRKSANAAVSAAKSKPKPTIVNKLADINNKLRAASIQSEGEVKIEIEKAIEDNQTTQEEAIKNLESAGVKVEGSPIVIDTSTKASGKLTAVTDTSVSIGTAKFLLTKDTKYSGTTLKDLKIGVSVDIKGEIKDNKSYATEITLVIETKDQPTTGTTDTPKAN